MIPDYVALIDELLSKADEREKRLVYIFAYHLIDTTRNEGGEVE